MGAPKLYSKLYVEKVQETNLRDKKVIEALIKRLNERLQRNPEDCKKAALILESWLKKKS
jgi:hypothetical protein